MEALLRGLLEELDRIGADHQEVYDTVVREKMRAAVTDGFIAPIEDFTLPDDFGMYSPEGNTAVKEALRGFIPSATQQADGLALDTFHKRLAAFQNDDVMTEKQSTYDEFFSWAKPEEYDADGNWLGYR